MLTIADHQFSSRLFTGTGKFSTSALMLAAIECSGSQLVTMAMKRLDLKTGSDDILQPLLSSGVKLLPIHPGPEMPKRRSLRPNWPEKSWVRAG